MAEEFDLAELLWGVPSDEQRKRRRAEASRKGWATRRRNGWEHPAKRFNLGRLLWSHVTTEVQP